MEFANNFLMHLHKIGYTGDIGPNDVQQVSQGVVKPILQFLMNIIKDKNTAGVIKGNLDLLSSTNNEEFQTFNSEEITQLEKCAALNYLKIKNLTDELKVRQSKKLILAAHCKNLVKTKEKMEEFQKNLKITEEDNNKLNENCEEIGENLAIIANQHENIESSLQDLNRISSTFKNSLKSVTVYPKISDNLGKLNNETLGKIKNFNPEEEFLHLGVSLAKENGMYKVEEVDSNTVIERLKSDNLEKREKIWNEFEQTEGILEEVQKLKEKLKILTGKQVFTNKKLQNLHNITLNLAGKKAQLEILKQIFNDLQSKLQQKDSQRNLSKSHNENMPDSQPLSQRITESIAKHSIFRREILKKKLQIEEFQKKILTPLQSSLPSTLTPVIKPIKKELKVFLQLPNLHPFNIPQKKLIPEAFNSLFTLTPCTLNIFHLSQLLNCEKFADPEIFLKKLKIFQLAGQKFFPLYQIPSYELGSFSGQSSKNVLENIKKEAKLAKDSISQLEKILKIWVEQPAQHLIPWRKDHLGLNISEALMLWKSSVLGE